MNSNHDMRRRFFDADANTYEVARPPYPPRVFELLDTVCGIGPGSSVLEIGAGTGLATGELLRRGVKVTAVEPGAQLAKRLSDRLGGPSLEVVVDDFETADLRGEWSAAISATAFHWLRTDVAIPKLAKLIRPGGWLAVWWHVFTDPDQPTVFRDALNQLYADFLPHEQRTRDSRPGPLRPESWVPDLEQGGWFGPACTEFIRWNHRLTGTGARLLFASFPNVGELADGPRTAFLDSLERLIDDRFDGCVNEPYVTAVYLLPLACSAT